MIHRINTTYRLADDEPTIVDHLLANPPKTLPPTDPCADDNTVSLSPRRIKRLCSLDDFGTGTSIVSRSIPHLDHSYYPSSRLIRQRRAQSRLAGGNSWNS